MQLLILCACVIEVFAFQEDSSAARFARQAFGKVERRRPAHVLFQVILELVLEPGIFPSAGILFL